MLNSKLQLPTLIPTQSSNFQSKLQLQTTLNSTPIQNAKLLFKTSTSNSKNPTRFSKLQHHLSSEFSHWFDIQDISNGFYYMLFKFFSFFHSIVSSLQTCWWHFEWSAHPEERSCIDQDLKWIFWRKLELKPIQIELLTPSPSHRILLQHLVNIS